MNKPLVFSMVRRILILAILSVALVTLMVSRSQTVKADSELCSTAYWNFSSCYYFCAVQNGTCHYTHPNDPQCEINMQICLMGCDTYHTEYGSSCIIEHGLEHYDHPVVPNAACEANAERLYQNCKSGPVPFALRETYFSCMTEVDGDINYADYCCGVAEDHYLEVGCS